MSKMSQLHAAMCEANNGVDPFSPDDSDWDSPLPPFEKHQRVRVYLRPSGNYCRGWVEDVESHRIGVRLVNGNFRWCRVSDVAAESANRGYGPFGASDANR